MIERLLARRGVRLTGIVGVMLLLGGLAACGGGSHSQPPPSGGGGGGGGGGRVAPFFFAVHINNPNSTFPSTAGVPNSRGRLLDTHNSPATTNISPGTYESTSLEFL